MAKKVTIVGTVFTPEYGADLHNWFRAVVTVSQARQILRLSEMIKSVPEGYGIEVWDRTAEPYSRRPVRPGCKGVLQLPQYDEKPGTADWERGQEPEAFDLGTLVVTDDNFHWAWHPRHAQELCESESCDIVDLVKAFAAKGVKL